MTYVADRVSEKVANVGAVAAMGTPWWLPSLHDVSGWCADWLPIVGFVWLLVQIGFKLYERWKHRNKEDEE